MFKNIEYLSYKHYTFKFRIWDDQRIVQDVRVARHARAIEYNPGAGFDTMAVALFYKNNQLARNLALYFKTRHMQRPWILSIQYWADKYYPGYFDAKYLDCVMRHMNA